MAGLRLEIITPDKVAFSEEVHSVILPSADGEMGALANHVPMVTMLNPGELQVQQINGESLNLAVGEGFVEVTGHHVSVLTDMALESVDINESVAEEAIKRAEEALKSEPADSDEAKLLMASIQRNVAQLKVKRRKRG
ncbi:MAG: ATP synthase F1 subunit epsilon [Verrucomicrobiota bacterium]